MRTPSLSIYLLLSFLATTNAFRLPSPALIQSRPISSIVTQLAPPLPPSLTQLNVLPPTLSSLIPSAAATLMPAIPPSLLPPKPLIPALINSLLFALSTSKISNHLTPSGLVHAFLLATGLSSFGGWAHWSTAVCYFGFGVMVTKFRMKEKTSKGIAEGERESVGRRRRRLPI